MVKKRGHLPNKESPHKPSRRKGKQSGHGVCGATALCLPCCGELSCQWLCDKMSYLAARVPIPSNMHTLPSVLNTPLHCLPPATSSALGLKQSLQGGKEERARTGKEKTNSLSRTGSHANGTPLKTPPCSESAPPRGLLPSLWLGGGLIF